VSPFTDNAMHDACGQVFFPDNLSDALYLYAMHDARPCDPGRFPWRCPETSRLWRTSDGACPVELRCALVDNHAGEHRAEVAW
jgi:hypothetical protein